MRRTRGPLATTVRVRGGSPALRSLAEPRRAGPAHLAALAARLGASRTEVRARAAWWAWMRGVPGAAGALEVHRTMVHDAAVVIGCEEQHGTRRDPAWSPAPSGAASMRQGIWCAWRGRRKGRVLEVRHELWGGRAFARAALRRAFTASGEQPLPFGAVLAWSHTSWSTGGGETLWTADDDGERLTLRPATGLGRRTRAGLVFPLAGGRARADVQWTDSPTRSGTPSWTLQWTRRMRP